MWLVITVWWVRVPPKALDTPFLSAVVHSISPFSCFQACTELRSSSSWRNRKWKKQKQNKYLPEKSGDTHLEDTAEDVNRVCGDKS